MSSRNGGADGESAAPVAHRAHSRRCREEPERDQGQAAAGYGATGISGGKTIRRLATEELADLVATDAKLKGLEKELAAAVRASGSHLMDLRGIGPAGEARIVADVGDVAPFPDRNHFASWTGTAAPRPQVVSRSFSSRPPPATARLPVS